MTEPIRGVNLGGWLLLEPWMTPSLFTGTDAVDEHTFMATPDARTRLRAHHETFVTEDDFAWLAEHRIELVRIPVGHWVLQADPPYLEAPDLLDAAFDWAQKHGLKVLLDLHGVSGSQNGRDHSGLVGPRAWYRERSHREHTHRTLAELALRYRDHPALWGLELVNEPMDWRAWTLRAFHRAAYEQVRYLLRPGTRVVFHDGYAPWVFRRTARSRSDHPLLIDTHLYQCFFPWDTRRDFPGVLRKARNRRRLIRWLSKVHPVVVGEWSAGLAAGVAATDEDGKVEQYKAFLAAQLEGFADAAAWCFWSYKTEARDAWNFRYLVEVGAIS